MKQLNYYVHVQILLHISSQNSNQNMINIKDILSLPMLNWPLIKIPQHLKTFLYLLKTKQKINVHIYCKRRHHLDYCKFWGWTVDPIILQASGNKYHSQYRWNPLSLWNPGAFLFSVPIWSLYLYLLLSTGTISMAI